MAEQSRQLTDEELQDLVASNDTGGRAPSSKKIMLLMLIIAFAWSAFQLWAAQIQNVFNGAFPGLIKVIGSSQVRPVHLAFAFALAFLAYPAFKSSSRIKIPLADWVLAGISVFCTIYVLVIFGNSTADPAMTGTLSSFQFGVAVVGLLCLAEVARRALGPALVILGAILVAYAFFGHLPFFDSLGIRIPQKSASRIMIQLWYGQEGVFGTPLKVSAVTVFLFVLFGALLEKAGAGNYFIKMAFGGLGHLRGGPAKAAVVGSAATGLISGSSIANVVTTGTFTIPLMKRVGFTSEKAGAVEVASSVNGQIMPPVMGAAAFLMVEYIGIPYTEVVKHAFIPAIISYIALVYLVHLEALKNNFPALPKPGGGSTNILVTIASFIAGFVIFGGLCYGLSYPFAMINNTFGSVGIWIIGLLSFAVFAWLCWIAALRPDLEPDDPNSEQVSLPIVKDVAPTGFYFLLPIVALIYLLMIEQKSANFSAFWAVILLMVMMLTQHVIKGIARNSETVGHNFKIGVNDVTDGMITGARNMIGVAIATAAAGVIVGVVSVTDLSSKMAVLVNILAGDNLFIMLGLVAIFSLILGMGLPTTANYIIVSSIMVGVIVSLGASKDLVIPLIAAHLFVFYFGIMADVTPPVGLASFAAAAVSGGDPIKTGFTAFFYSLRTVLLPFLFIFNTDLILYGVDLGTSAGWLKALWIFVTSTIAMLIFAAATQGYFFAKSKLWESAALIAVALLIFNPGILQNRIQPPYVDAPGQTLSESLSNVSEGQEIRLVLDGTSIKTGEAMSSTASFISDGTDPIAQAQQLGFAFDEAGIMSLPGFGTPADEQVGQSLNFLGGNTVSLSGVQLSTHQWPKIFFMIPALILLIIVVLFQRRRQTVPAF